MRGGLLAILLLTAALGVRPAAAQVFRLSLDSVPLEEALRLVQEQGNVDIVFAHRLIQDRRSDCRYVGSRIADALTCVLGGTGVQWQSIRSRQYVLVGIEPGDAAMESIPRGVIAGFVTDVETGEVLPGASVYLPELRLGTVTNTAGYFAIAQLPRGEYHLYVSYVGYEPVSKPVQVDSLPKSVTLQPVTLEGEGVVVERERGLGAEQATLPGAVSLPAQTLESLPSFPGEQDLLQSLQWLPGIQKLGELNGTLIVRGGEADQNLYLLDGVPVYHPWHAFSLISTFQTETFKDVNIYRGAFPAEYGGRLSAVVDTQLKDGSRNGAHVSAALSLLSGRLMVESPLGDKASVMVSGRRSYLDQIIGRTHPVSNAEGQRDTLRTGYHFYDLSGKITYRPALAHRFSLMHYRGRDLLDLRLPFDFSLDFSSWLRPADLFFEIDQDWGNRLTGLRYQYLASNRFFLTTTAYHTSYYADEGALLRPTTTARLASRYEVDLRDFGLKLDGDYYHSAAHQAKAGIHLVHHSFRSRLDAVIARTVSAVEEQHDYSRLEAWELSAYVQDVWQPRARWQILPGLRASVFGEGAYFRINPSLGARYVADPDLLVLRGSVSTQTQYMHRLRDRYSFMYDLVSSRWIPSGRSVRPSSNIQVAAGAESRPWPWLKMIADVYWRSSDDILLPQDVYQTKDGLEGPGIELGTLLAQYTPAVARAYGIELTAQVQQGPWQGWVSYSGGRSLTRVPAWEKPGYFPSRFDVPRSVHSVVNHTRGRWEFMLAAEARSGYPHSVPVARYEIGDPLGEDQPHLYRPSWNNGRLPPYARLDASAMVRFRLFGAKWRSRLYIYNVLNHRSTISRIYDPSKEIVEPVDRRSLPLIPLLEFEITI